MAAPFGRRIVVDGNDGTGKSTLVRGLRSLGFSRVEDRAEMTKASDDESVGPAPDTTYLLAHCRWETSFDRLRRSGADMSDQYHQPDALQHYAAVFLGLQERFGAIPICTEETTPPDVLEAAIRGIMRDEPFRIGVPKGRLPASALGTLLGVVPASRRAGHTNERRLTWQAGPWLFLKSRTAVYPKLVAFGELDVALCGSDVLDKSPFAEQVHVIARLPQAGVRMVVATATGAIPPRPLLRVATEFRDVATDYFAARGIPHTIFGLSGASEGFVPRFADAVVDIVETGGTLEANGLRVVEDLGELSVCSIRRRVP